MAACPDCGSENPTVQKFCGNCGRALASVCPACASSNPPGQRFCGECGASLAASTPESAGPPARTTEAPAAERRLVSVLFADLVAFTSLSEARDPEEVRELLSRYFESCRRLVELYGGVVEKFIGDAVMAVWGTPMAQEDDAERAVRTALDLVAAVSTLGDEVGVPELRARAGVLTGEAAVNLAGAGQGMVAGDLVNTASRIQTVAEPGTVLVGEATRRASERAVAFEDAGEHVLKGKAEPVPLWRAVRVMAARGGALRSEGLEAPFVARERELRLVKELYHAVAEQSRAQLVQITGIAGIGKSRLAWEFFKYLDGLADQAFWHRGRCLAYGERVGYWALAEMVRSRADILESEEPAVARAKLAACLDAQVPDADERAWMEPRLANLLGLEERADSDRQDLFAAWRLFFERLADEDPVVLVFEDLQWADEALLAFVEYLLEWTSAKRLYVVALARPEFGERHPEFGRLLRNSANLALEPLTDEEMGELLDGYVPGLPGELRTQILERAEGVPLYAVETVRMLLDRGLLVQEGAAYRPVGPIETLAVPETLHALMAARLDGLPAEEHRLVQDACVLGKSFTAELLAGLAGRTPAQLEPLLAGLVRKEVLVPQVDPRMPERGQYAFLQELLRQVAYETLSRRDRKARHLAAVSALERSSRESGQEAPEALAAHLLAADAAAPDDPDATEIRLRARSALTEAGERAAALAAPEEGQRYFDQAAALAEGEPEMRASLLARSGTLSFRAGRPGDARERLEQAIALFEELGDTRAAARTSVALTDVDLVEGRMEQASHRFQAALPTLEQAGPSAELAATLAQLGRMQLLHGDPGEAATTLERALLLAETLALDEVFAQALTTRATVLMFEDRPMEAEILFEAALARSSAASLHDAWWRAANNLAILFEQADRLAEALALAEEMAEQARHRGDRELLAAARFGSIPMLLQLGRWQEALTLAGDPELVQTSEYARAELIALAAVLCEQGRPDAAEAVLQEQGWQRDAEGPEARAGFAAAEARLLRALGRPGEAHVAAERGLALRDHLGMASTKVRRCLLEALEARLALDDLAGAEEMLNDIGQLQPGQLTPSLLAEHARLRARLDARRGNHDEVDRNYRTAEALFAQLGLVFQHAVAQLEHAEWLAGQGRGAEAGPLLADARGTLERLEARPWLERLDTALAGTASAIPA